MEVIDDFLEFLSAAYGTQPDRLKALERQTIALLAVAATSRFAPRLSQGAINNAVTRGAALYVARHPFATIAAFWFASKSNVLTRPQWAGPYTQEVNTALGTLLLAHGGQGLLWLGRQIAPIFNPALVAEVSSSYSRLSQMQVPPLLRALFGNRAARWVGRTLLAAPGRAINNPGTRGTARYLSRHPAAALGAYFVGSYIDSTYRPQFFGPYTREIITGGLVPVFAHSPRVVPPLIRAAGTGIYYSSNGLASVLQWFTRPAARTLVGEAGHVPSLTRLRLLSWLNYIELIGNNSQLWGFATRTEHQILLIAGALRRAYPLLSTRWALAQARSLYLTGDVLYTTFSLENNAPSRTMIGRLGSSLWQRLQSPTGRRIILGAGVGGGIAIYGWYTFANVAWRAAHGGDGPYWYEYPFLVPLVGEVTGGAIAGGRPAAMAIVHHFGNNLRWAASPFVSGERFIRPYLSSLFSFLRVPQAASLAAGALPALRVGAGYGIGAARGFGQIAAGVGRFAASNWSVPALLPVTLAEIGLELQSYSDNLFAMDERILGRLTSMEYLQRQGYRFAQPVSATRSMYLSGGYRLNMAETERFLRRWLEFVTLQDEIARQALQVRSLVRVIERSATVVGALAFGVDQAAQGLDQWLSRVQQSQQQQSRARPDAWRTQPRDERGRWIRPQWGFSTGQPLPGIGFNEALAYVNRRAAAAALVRTQSATTGMPIQPAISRGVASEAPPGKGREFWLYRSRDRRLLLQTFRDMLEIGERDKLEESGKKTTQISVREPIFGDGVPGLPGAIIQVTRALKYDVSLVRNRGPLGGYYPLSDDQLQSYLESMWPNLNPFGADED